MKIAADTTPAGLAAILEFADEFQWTVTATGQRADNRTLVELAYGPHTILAWFFDGPVTFDKAALHRKNYPGEFNRVAYTEDRGTVVGWVAAHGTRKAAAA